MSYEITGKRRQIQARAEAVVIDELSDLRRARFLMRLDGADIEISDWEAQFIESVFARDAGDGFRRVKFTAKQRDVIDRMMERYDV